MLMPDVMTKPEGITTLPPASLEPSEGAVDTLTEPTTFGVLSTSTSLVVTVLEADPVPDHSLLVPPRHRCARGFHVRLDEATEDQAGALARREALAPHAGQECISSTTPPRAGSTDHSSAGSAACSTFSAWWFISAPHFGQRIGDSDCGMATRSRPCRSVVAIQTSSFRNLSIRGRYA